VTSDELVDDMIADFRLSCAQPAEPVVSRMHSSSSEPSPDLLVSQIRCQWAAKVRVRLRVCHGVGS
jgi:hypothetical protein